MALDKTLVDKFLSYLLQREEVRLRRLRGESQEDAAPNDIFRSVRLCCVHRQHDPSSALVQEQLLKLRTLGGGGGLVIFAAAVLRGFGGRSFIQRLSMEKFLQLETWTAQTWHFVVETALTCWDAGDYAFTEAYNPSRCYHVEETRARRSTRMIAQAAYDRRCGDLLDLWLQSTAMAAVIIPLTTWRTAVHRVSQVRGFGGTGFAAKELVLDAASSSDLSQASDFNKWCPVGPGARRAVRLRVQSHARH